MSVLAKVAGMDTAAISAADTATLKAELAKRTQSPKDTPTLTPQQLAERLEMAEGIKELAQVMNDSVTVDMSDDDRATLKTLFDQRKAALKK